LGRKQEELLKVLDYARKRGERGVRGNPK